MRTKQRGRGSFGQWQSSPREPDGITSMAGAEAVLFLAGTAMERTDEESTGSTQSRQRGRHRRGRS